MASTQRGEGSSETAQNMDVDPPEQKDPFDEPYVKRRSLRILRRGPLGQLEDFRIWITPDSTYGDVKDHLLAIGHDQAIVFQANLGPKTFWTEPSVSTPVESTLQSLYALVDASEPYLLGVVRTPTADCLIPIFGSQQNRAVTVLGAISVAQPGVMTSMDLVHNYVTNDKNIGFELLDFQNRMNAERRSYAFPTAFFVNVTQREPHIRHVHYKSIPPSKSIPPILQLPVSHFTYLSQEVSRLISPHRRQIFDLLQAMAHVLSSFAETLQPLFNDEVPDLEAAVIRDDFLVELLPLVPLFTMRLKHIIDRIEQLVKDVKDFMAYDIEKKMDDIFLELCGDFPGAIANRILYTVSPYNKPSYIPPTSLRSFSYTRLSDNDANPFDTSIESFYVDRIFQRFPDR